MLELFSCLRVEGLREVLLLLELVFAVLAELFHLQVSRVLLGVELYFKVIRFIS